MSLEKFAQRHASNGPSLPPLKLIIGLLIASGLIIGGMLWQNQQQKSDLAEKAYLKSKDYVQQHELSIAEDEIAKALKYQEKSDYYEWQYIILSAQDKDFEAEKSLRRAKELEPNNADVQYTWAHFWYDKSENLAEAFKSAKHASELEPKNIDYLILCASILAQQQDYPSAIEWTKKATKLDPKNTEAWSILSGQYVANNEPEKAYALIQKLTKNFPEISTYWVYLAQISEKLGKKDDAIQAYQKYMTMEPDFAEAAAYRISALTGKPVEEKYRVIVEDSIPIERAHNRMTCKMSVNKTYGKFLIDTGAEVTIVTKEFIEANHIPVTALESAASISGIGGQINAKVAYVTIKLGRFEFKNQRVVIIPEATVGPNLSGILGMDILGRFNPSVNNQKQRLVLSSK